MKDHMDNLLQQALSPDVEPSPWLDKKIIQMAKETKQMATHKKRKFFGTAATIAAALTVCSLGVFAGWKYLAPDKVASEFSDQKLAKAFQTEDAILVNEIQEFPNYRITLLGLVSGKGLSKYAEFENDTNIEIDKTYVVTAIENADGTPRPAVSDEDYGSDPFYVSPYIQGLPMHEFNAHTFRGGYSENVIDGIQYRILECDNIEMFAYGKIYLGVSEGCFYNNQAFVMDDTTGEITRNGAYDGVNALFTLPIPSFKGDRTAAESYIRSMQTPSEDEASTEEGGFDNIAETIEKWTLDDFEANMKCAYKEELIPDNEGYLNYSYQLESGTGTEDSTMALDSIFTEGQTGLSEYFTLLGDPEDSYLIETFERLDNGHVILRVFEN